MHRSKEALAITWACDRFADFLMGLKFHVRTDHKPLVSLLSNSPYLALNNTELNYKMTSTDYIWDHNSQHIIATKMH